MLQMLAQECFFLRCVTVGYWSLFVQAICKIFIHQRSGWFGSNGRRPGVAAPPLYCSNVTNRSMEISGHNIGTERNRINEI